jgi:putative oxidoreductase
MKHFPTVIAGLLGCLFILSGMMGLLNLGPQPNHPADSAATHFMTAFGPTGYFTLIKVCEVAGGLFIAIPRYRNLGLLILGPILINILSFHAFILVGKGLADPMLIGICLATAYLLWVERRAFCNLICRCN